MRNIIEIQNLNGLATQIGNFDVATEKALFYGDNKELTENWKGIYNNNSGKLAQVVSKNYQIIQHNDVIQSLVETLGEKGIQVKGRLDDFGNQIRTDLVFTNKGVPIKDDATGVQLGIRVLNSYNRATSFRLELFGFRMVCNNGMSLGKALNQVRECVFHMGKQKNLEEIRKITSGFIEKVINSSNILQNLIDQSRTDVASWDKIAKLLEELVPHKKHRNKIFDDLGIAAIEVENKKTKKKSWNYVLDDQKMKEISRWDLYNSLTKYATHAEKLGISVENSIQETAQKILKKNYEDLITVETQ